MHAMPSIAPTSETLDVDVELGSTLGGKKDTDSDGCNESRSDPVLSALAGSVSGVFGACRLPAANGRNAQLTR